MKLPSALSKDASQRAALTRLVGLAACILILAPATHASEAFPWPTKTGPHRNGNADPEHAKGVPVSWDEETGENIAWRIAIEGTGHSTPVIGEGRIWLTSATEDGTRQFVYCIDVQSGSVIHHKLLFENANPEPLGNVINTYASPTCVLDGDAVYVHFGTYGTARLDAETADVVWQRRDINVRHFRGPGSSPVVVDGLVILSFDGIDKQFLTALDAETGDTVWTTPRTTDFKDLDETGQPTREGDLRKAYSTPAIMEVAGRKQVVSVGSRAAFGYDLLTGKELWTIEHDDYNAGTRPLPYGETVIINTGSRNANLLRLRMDSSTRGNVTKSHELWNRPTGNSELPFPVLHGDRIYFVTDNGVATCIDALAGEEIWKKRIGGDYTASPIVANGLVYFFDDQGKATIVRATDEYEVVAVNRLNEGMRSSPAIAYGALYLRSFDHLYKIAAN